MTRDEQEKDRSLPETTESNTFTRTELRAGLFVLLAMFILAFFYFFGKDIGTLFQPHKRLVVLFDDISGLETSTSVKFAGMAIGKVTDIRIVEAKDYRVEVDLNVLSEVPLREGTTASIRATELVIGKYIDLSGGSPEAPLLKDGAVIRGSQEPLIDEVINSAGRIILDVRDIVNEINRITKEQNLEKLIANLNRMAEIAAGSDDGILNNLQGSLKELKEAGLVDNLIAITESLAQNKDRIIGLVEQGNKLAVDSNRLFLDHKEQISSLIVELSGLAGAFSGNAETLANNLTALSSNAMTMSDDLPRLVRNTDALLSKMDRSLDSLNMILEKTENIDETDVRRFLQHEGVRIYFSERKAPPLEPEAP